MLEESAPGAIKARLLLRQEKTHLTDTQILTIAVAFIFPVAMLIFSNSRITEAKETLRAEMGTLRAEMNARFDRIDSKIEALLKTMADIDQRVAKLEEGKH